MGWFSPKKKQVASEPKEFTTDDEANAMMLRISLQQAKDMRLKSEEEQKKKSGQ